jgi:hypothetical protein
MKATRFFILSTAVLALAIQVLTQTTQAQSAQNAKKPTTQNAAENKWESLSKFMETLFAAYFPLSVGVYDNAKKTSGDLMNGANALKSDMPAKFNNPEVLSQIDALTAITKIFDDAVKANESDSILGVKLTSVKKAEGELISVISKNAK